MRSKLLILLSALVSLAANAGQPIVINGGSNWSKVEIVNYYDASIPACAHKSPLSKGDRWMISADELEQYAACNNNGSFGLKFYGNWNRANWYLADFPVKPGQICKASFSVWRQELLFSCE